MIMHRLFLKKSLCQSCKIEMWWLGFTYKKVVGMIFFGKINVVKILMFKKKNAKMFWKSYL